MGDNRSSEKDAVLEKTLFRLGSMQGDCVTPFRYPNCFNTEKTTGPDRLCMGVDDAQISWLWKLALSLPAPYYVLYILHTSWCENQPGRYQSPAIDFQVLNGFMAECCDS
jgi:hypothetical protein